MGWALRSGPHSRSSRSEAERTRSIAAPGSCLVAFLALALGLASTARANDFERADSLVLIVADDLGIDRVGCYADTAARTPNIDQLATEGTRFETCWAAPRCTPARAMILTGLFPYRTGIGGKMKPSDTFDLSLPSLADLSTSGRAHLIGKWHLTQDVNAPGLMGFEHRGSMKNIALYESYFRWWKNVEGTLQPSFLYATTDNVDEAIRSLDHDVVILMFNAPHKPRHVPPQHLHSYGTPASPSRQYRAMVEAMDSEIGRLLAAIDSDPTRNPWVIFTSDNGTPQDVVEEGEDPLKMKGSHFEGGLRVPLIVRGPGVAAGVVDKRLTSVVDFYATAKELLGVPGSVPVDSVSIFSDAPRRWIFAETFQPNGFGPYQWRSRSVRNDRFKLHCRRYPLIQERALFDLWTDPRENHNLLEGPLTSEEQAAYAALLALLP